LAHRLNCLCRATASTAMVRSSVSVPSASIGLVRLAAPVPASSTSVAAMPA